MEEHHRAMLITWGQHHDEVKVRQLADELERLILEKKRKQAIRQTAYEVIERAVRPCK